MTIDVKTTPKVKAETAAEEGAGSRVLNWLAHAVLVLWAIGTAGPLLWAVVGSFKTDAQIQSDPWGLPDALHVENWTKAWQKANIGHFFINTVIVTAGALALTMLLGAMLAYVLARFEFRGARFIYYSVVAGMMFPIFLALVPLAAVVKNAGLMSTKPGLILVYTAYSLPFTVFFLTAFFRTQPSAIAEAALIDGCGHFGVFFRVMLPMAWPGLVSVGLFNFVKQWNEYLLPLVLNSQRGDQTGSVLAQGLAQLVSDQGYRGDDGALFAGLTITMLPVLVVYILFHRRLQAGLTAGHLK